MIDHLPAEIALPLAALAWIAYALVVRHQSSKEER